MFKTISALYPVDADFPARVQKQLLLAAVRDATFYSIFDRAYHEDRFVITGEFFPEHRRAPSITSGLAMARASVDTAVGFVFGDAHYPACDSPDDTVRQALEDFTIDARLVEKMREAALVGSVGSVAIRFRILRQRPHVDVWPTTYLTPVWDPEAPDELASVTELRKVSGEDLRAQGYTVAQDDLGSMHWFQRVWDDAGEWWFTPWPVGRGDDREQPHVPQVDGTRSVTHALGFCPWVWIRNLPGGDELDGECTFIRGIDTLIEIDYRLSGGGRALKYSSDPTLLIKDPLLTDGEIERSAGQAIVVGASGDAKILEMTGHSTRAVEHYCQALRGYALEAMHGVRADPDRIASAVSGLALERLYEPMLNLASHMRTSYGEGGLLVLLRMLLRARQRGAIKLMGAYMPLLDPNVRIGLKWGPWFAPTADDRVKLVTSSQIAIQSGILSREQAVKNGAALNDIADVDDELAEIQSDILAEDARAKALTAQVQAKSNLTS